jgi:hypothetical protein
MSAFAGRTGANPFPPRALTMGEPAGTGRADPASLIAALQTAQQMASLRQWAAQRSVA